MTLFWNDPFEAVMLILYHYGFALLPMVPALAVAIWARRRVAGVASRADQPGVELPIDGAGAASATLEAGGAPGRSLVVAEGPLANFYDPSRRELRLSRAAFEGRTPEAVGIAAHEAGHALQDAQAYRPLRLRTPVIFAAKLGSLAAWMSILAGVVMLNPRLCERGASLYLALMIALLALQVVERDANRRSRAATPPEGLGGPDADAFRRAFEAARWVEIASTLPIPRPRRSPGWKLFG